MKKASKHQAVAFTNKQGLTIKGSYYPNKTSALIIFLHGFTGDRHEWGKFDTMAEQLQEQGYAVLTFDFAGCGESDDTPLTIKNQIDDFHTVLAWAKEKGFTTIGILGLSLGGLIAFLGYPSYQSLIKTIVGWAPVTNKTPNDITYLKKRYTEDQCKELLKKGYLTKTRDKGVRKKFIISKQLFDERAAIHQETVLRKIQCPVLLIHGDHDDRVPLEDSKQAMHYLPQDSVLTILHGANHMFQGKEQELWRITLDWFLTHLPL